MTLPNDADLIDALVAAAIAAGGIILTVRDGGLSVERKADASPVTEADRAAEREITTRLASIAPDIAVVAEEAVSEGRIPEIGDAFFLVDPLDGTREFVKGGNDFTVNIGLIRNGKPEVGVIYVPATKKLFAGAVGLGAWRTEVSGGVAGERRPMRVRAAPDGPIVVVASRSHRTPETDTFIRRFDVGELINRGSSLKFCVIAEGKADLYPRMGTTMQWDTAAGEAILRAAGGRVVTTDGTPLFYGRNREGELFRNPWFIATGGIDPLQG
ncbi:MAG: 3'(2'),5'-bisphosphate nucleotidase CysQ [Bauldia sp.]